VTPGTAGRALLLTPSRGLGGGIERYADTLEWAFAAQGVECRRVDLRAAGRPSGAIAWARMAARSRRHLQGSAPRTRIVVTHRALMPLAALLAWERPSCGISVVCHGSDVWGTGPPARRYVEKRLMCRSGVRVVAVSSFTAGALSGVRPATVLPPGLSRDWFQELVDASARAQRAGQTGPSGRGDGRGDGRGVRLVTAFRLAQWRDKGLPQLLGAVAALGRADVRVTVCGSGEPTLALRQLARRHPCCTLMPGLTDSELAGQLAGADLLVLATRTRRGRRPSGEGFGLVLLEAQVAGTPVIAPAFGGCRDAYSEGLTGVAPANETSGSLARVLGELLRDPGRLEQMSKHAAGWARERFAPERYAALVASRLL
jgi:phosphatidyl-myo-inositol dimannoside synthase